MKYFEWRLEGRNENLENKRNVAIHFNLKLKFISVYFSELFPALSKQLRFDLNCESITVMYYKEP